MENETNNMGDLEYTNLLHSTLNDKINELNTLYRNLPGGVIHCSNDDQFEIFYANDGFFELTGYSREELRDKFNNKLLGLIHPDDLSSVLASSASLNMENTPNLKVEYRITAKNGEILFILEYGRLMANSFGTEKICCVLVDITAEKNIQEALRQSEERYKILVEQSDNICFDWDFTNNSMILSGLYKKFTGFDPIENPTNIETVYTRVHPDDVPIYKQWEVDTFKKKSNTSAEFRFATIDGGFIWVKSHSTTLCNDNGEPVRAVGSFTNISNQKNTISYLEMKAQLDSLTKLYNKSTTETKIREYINSAGVNTKGALLMVDIDNFKGVNDNLGHQFGDMVLQDVAQKIENLFRETDILGRIGGDEFSIFMCNIKGEGEVCKKAEALLNAVRNIYFGENTQYEISLSIGVAYFPLHGDCFERLYKVSDNALYESKRKGKNCYTVFQDDLQENADSKNLIGRTSFETSDRFLSSYYEGDLIYSIFEMLYETSDITTTLNKILEIVGKKFNVSRVYIFEQSDDGKYYNNTYEWCGESVLPEIDNLQNILADSLGDFFKLYNKECLLTVSNINDLDEFSFNLLDRQEVKSILHCGISGGGKMKGFIGFDDCHKYRQWRGEEIAILGYISRILSIFILKR